MHLRRNTHDELAGVIVHGDWLGDSLSCPFHIINHLADGIADSQQSRFMRLCWPDQTRKFSTRPTYSPSSSVHVTHRSSRPHNFVMALITGLT